MGTLIGVSRAAPSGHHVGTRVARTASCSREAKVRLRWHFFFFFFFSFWPHGGVCGALARQPGIEPGALQWKRGALTPDHRGSACSAVDFLRSCQPTIRSRGISLSGLATCSCLSHHICPPCKSIMEKGGGVQRPMGSGSPDGRLEGPRGRSGLIWNKTGCLARLEKPIRAARGHVRR